MPTPRTRPASIDPPLQRSPAHRHIRRLLAATTAATLSIAATIAMASSASATTATGPEGQTVTVSASEGLDPDGETITVEGSGFDLSKGIYVVLCVDNGAGQQPTPCLGGVDMEGAGGSSAWISSNPPSYGEGLAQPFDEMDGTGSFEVTLQVAARDEFTDCLDESVAPDGCVVGTRADHTRTGDRSADVLIPVTFATESGGNQETGGDTAGSGDVQGSTDAGDGGDAGDSGDAGDASGVTGTGATEDGADASSAGDDLAETGVSAGTAAMAAVALLGAGGAILTAHRRAARRPVAHGQHIAMR